MAFGASGCTGCQLVFHPFMGAGEFKWVDFNSM